MSEKATLILPEERRRQILQRLTQEGKVVAADLSTTFRVSEDTIRRDLRDLAEARLLQRVHGGALPLSPVTASYATRTQQQMPSKMALARKAAQLARHGQVILVDGGTTNLEVAQCLSTELRATVLTTSPPIAMALAEHPRVDVVLIGGKLDKQEMVVTGATASENVRLVHADLCILGVYSLHPELGITATDSEYAQLKRIMIQQAAEVVAVATADKLGAAAPHVVAPISALTHLVTENSVSDATLAPYAAAGITVLQG